MPVRVARDEAARVGRGGAAGVRGVVPSLACAADVEARGGQEEATAQDREGPTVERGQLYGLEARALAREAKGLRHERAHVVVVQVARKVFAVARQPRERGYGRHHRSEEQQQAARLEQQVELAQEYVRRVHVLYDRAAPDRVHARQVAQVVFDDVATVDGQADAPRETHVSVVQLQTVRARPREEEVRAVAA